MDAHGNPFHCPDAVAAGYASAFHNRINNLTDRARATQGPERSLAVQANGVHKRVWSAGADSRAGARTRAGDLPILPAGSRDQKLHMNSARRKYAVSSTL